MLSVVLVSSMLASSVSTSASFVEEPETESQARLFKGTHLNEIFKMLADDSDTSLEGIDTKITAFKLANENEPIPDTAMSIAKDGNVFAWYVKDEVQPEETEIRFQIGDSPNTELDTTPKTTQKGQDTTQKNQDTTQKTTQKGQDTTQKILEEIKKNPSISRDELAEKCGLTSDGIKYNMRKLREKGIIKRIGPDKGGHWEIIE